MRLPETFCTQMAQLLGTGGARALEEALQKPSSVSIRLHPDKGRGFAVREAVPVPWCSGGNYLSSRPSFTFDPLFHAGCYYVQEASSMFLEQVIRRYVTAPVLALDACAAPGGKSTHLRSLLPEGSLLVANEVIGSRAQILAENLSKWGHPGVVTTNNDPADFQPLEHLFDVMLADVPCSGEGMFRKDEAAIGEWSPQSVELCRKRQRRILADLWPVLKPGGLLIYSTCTFNVMENEENVAWIAGELGADVLPVETPDEWGITGSLTADNFPVYRFLPHRTRGEGLFMAVLRKQEADFRPFVPKPVKKKEKQKSKMPEKLLRQAQQWVKEPTAFHWQADDSRIAAFPLCHAALLPVFNRYLRVLNAGTEVAQLKGTDLIPAHALVQSLIFEKASFLQTELTYEEAIAYLRKEAVQLPATLPRGYVTVTYRGVPLGWVKNLGNRANNLYPAEWRIRSTHPAEENSPLDACLSAPQA